LFDFAAFQAFLPERSGVLITKYGYDVVAVVLLIVVIGSALSWGFIQADNVKYPLIALFFLFFAFTLAFFRDPNRSSPAGPNLVVSPADGKVVLIKDVVEEEFIKGEGVQVSIFMSPLNVHVNRYPISGTVGYFRYFPGEFLVAFDEKASARNERTHIGIESARARLLFKQIAGFVARRIVADLKEGDQAVAGEKFGMIRFGSRVDVIMPRSVAVKVKVGEKTVAGETVLAEMS
jgi:phosphatidylserine decarboxylase